jgi:transcription initiation factor TFIIIB Brf1 subunit/transcription initiation factor TFIIB
MVTQEVCEACHSPSLFHDGVSADLVCQNCGVVACGRLIDRGPEWASFAEDDGEKTKGGHDRVDLSKVGSTDDAMQTHLVGNGSEELNKAYLNSDHGRALKRTERILDYIREISNVLMMTEATKVHHLPLFPHLYSLLFSSPLAPATNTKNAIAIATVLSGAPRESWIWQTWNHVFCRIDGGR